MSYTNREFSIGNGELYQEMTDKMMHTARVPMGWRRAVLLVGMLVLLTATAASSPAEAAQDKGKVYLLVVDKLSIYDLDPAATPWMNQLVSHGGVGLASTRTLRGKNALDASLTIGAGNIGRVYGNGILAYNRDEFLNDRGQTASHLYHNLTGISPGNASCLLVNLPEISTGIAVESVTTLPGAMGEVLRKNGRTACVLGNGDTGKDRNRSATVIAMDAQGQVPLGDIGPQTIMSSTESFLSRETNYEYLFKQVGLNKAQTDLFVIELADLARLEQADTAFPHIAQAEKQKRLRLIDRFVGQIAEQADPARDLIMVVSPSPAREQIKIKNNFIPLIMWGKGVPAGGLTSAATKRHLVVANTDIAPTVLAFFDLSDETGSMIGRPITIRPVPGGSLADAQQLSTKTSTVNRLRVPLVKGYVILQIIIILLALVAIFWLVELAALLEPFIVALVAVPLVYLFLGLATLPVDWMYMGAAVVLTAAVTAVVMGATRRNGFQAFSLLIVLTVLALNVDLLTGSHLIQSSVLGYDPMAGARYYGIGNEFMGILLGSSIALAGVAYQRYTQRWLLPVIGLFLAFQAFIMASPQLGANSDGMLTAPAAFLVTLILLGNLSIRPRTVFLVLGAVALAALAFTFYDMGRAPEVQTHIGRAAHQIAVGGWNEGLTIITRKLGMNIKLIRYTIWSWVFIIMLLVLSLLVYRPVGAMKQLRQDKPYVVKGFGGIITGALIGLVVNDSGIVAASTTSIYLVVPLLLLMLYQQFTTRSSLNRNESKR